MPRIELCFEVDVPHEDYEALMECEPGLEYEFVPELAEKIAPGTAVIVTEVKDA